MSKPRVKKYNRDRPLDHHLALTLSNVPLALIRLLVVCYCHYSAGPLPTTLTRYRLSFTAYTASHNLRRGIITCRFRCRNGRGSKSLIMFKKPERFSYALYIGNTGTTLLPAGYDEYGFQHCARDAENWESVTPSNNLIREFLSYVHAANIYTCRTDVPAPSHFHLPFPMGPSAMSSDKKTMDTAERTLV